MNENVDPINPPVKRGNITKLKKPEIIILLLTLFITLTFSISAFIVIDWSFVSESISLYTILWVAILISIPSIIYLLKHRTEYSTLFGIILLHFSVIFVSLLMLNKLHIIVFGNDIKIAYFLDKSTTNQRTWRSMKNNYPDLFYDPIIFKKIRTLKSGRITSILIREGWFSQKLISDIELEHIEEDYLNWSPKK